MQIIEGNIFTTKMQTIVNTINCVGVMGAGIAYECKLRYPEMYIEYVKYCKNGMITPGKLWLYKKTYDGRWILNFPTKIHWKDNSEPEYLIQGLTKFVATYKERGIESIAFPLLGANNGGIDPKVSLRIMIEFLEKCDIPIEIYKYNPNCYDDLLPKLQEKWDNSYFKNQLKKKRIRKTSLESLNHAIQNENYKT
ncbi:MAG: Appr-1-p processing protein, partial [Candidatus Hydrogenedentota bacterium]